LQRRLAEELEVQPDEVDLEIPADSYALDSVVVAQICSDMGYWVQGREISIDLWWRATSLREFCDSFGKPAAAPPASTTVQVTVTVEPPAAALFAAEGGRQLVLMCKESRICPPGERYRFAALGSEPELVSVSYRYVDEATGEPKDTTYYCGSYLQQIRAWVAPAAAGTGTGYELYVLNSSARALVVIAAAWTSTDNGGGGR